jgi:hypothetical protein
LRVGIITENSVPPIIGPTASGFGVRRPSPSTRSSTCGSNLRDGRNLHGVYCLNISGSVYI